MRMRLNKIVRETYILLGEKKRIFSTFVLFRFMWNPEATVLSLIGL